MKNQVGTDIGSFAIVPLWLLEAGVSPGAITTFALLWAKWADKEGRCWPSHASIADALGTSERTARRYLTELEGTGALSVTARWASKGAQTSNIYTLHAARPVGHLAGGVDTDDHGGGGHQCPGGVDTDDQGGWSPVSYEPYPDEPNPYEETISTPSEPSSSLENDGQGPPKDDSGEQVPLQPEEVLVEASPIMEELEEVVTTLVNEGHPESKVRAALTTKTADGTLEPAAWTTKRGKLFPPEVLIEALGLAVFFAQESDGAGNRAPNPYSHKECNPMRLLLTTDEKPPAHIRSLIQWTFQNDFWSSNVLCTSKFRVRWDQLAGQRRRDIKRREKAQGVDPGGEDWMARRKAG